MLSAISRSSPPISLSKTCSSSILSPPKSFLSTRGHPIHNLDLHLPTPAPNTNTVTYTYTRLCPFASFPPLPLLISSFGAHLYINILRCAVRPDRLPGLGSIIWFQRPGRWESAQTSRYSKQTRNPRASSYCPLSRPTEASKSTTTENLPLALPPRVHWCNDINVKTSCVTLGRTILKSFAETYIVQQDLPP